MTFQGPMCSAPECERPKVRVRDGKDWCLFHPESEPPQFDAQGRLVGAGTPLAKPGRVKQPDRAPASWPEPVVVPARLLAEAAPPMVTVSAWADEADDIAAAAASYGEAAERIVEPAGPLTAGAETSPAAASLQVVGRGDGPKKHQVSDEGRQRMRENALRTAEKRRAKREAQEAAAAALLTETKESTSDQTPQRDVGVVGPVDRGVLRPEDGRLVPVPGPVPAPDLAVAEDREHVRQLFADVNEQYPNIPGSSERPGSPSDAQGVGTADSPALEDRLPVAGRASVCVKCGMVTSTVHCFTAAEPKASRKSQLTTVQWFRLNEACRLVRKAFGGAHPYLVGSSTERPDYRDVDIRLILDDSYFDELFSEQHGLWELLCLLIGEQLARETGLPIDFQIQRMTEANAKYPGGKRHPLAMPIQFAGGGDATNLRGATA